MFPLHRYKIRVYLQLAVISTGPNALRPSTGGLSVIADFSWYPFDRKNLFSKFFVVVGRVLIFSF